jgi:hypothetical protein
VKTRHIQRRSHVKTQVEAGLLKPQAKGLLEVPEAGGGKKDSFLEFLNGIQLC